MPFVEVKVHRTQESTMTLEKIVPPLANMEDNFIPNSPSQKRRYHTLHHSMKYSESNESHKLFKDGINLSRHRTLNRTASDTAFIAKGSASNLTSSVWETPDIVDDDKNQKSYSKKKQTSRNDNKMPHNRFSLNQESYRHEQIVRSSSLKERSSSGSKMVVSGSKFADRGSRQGSEYSTLPRLGTYTGEIVLDFPCSSDQSSQTSSEKRPEKSKELRPDRTHGSIHHSLSMPGLCDTSSQQGKSKLADAKNVEPKSRPFFLFFLRKNKLASDRSASPCGKANPQNIRRCPSNLGAISRTESDRAPSPLLKDYSSACQSPVSSRQYHNSFSSNVPQTPSSPVSIASPEVSLSNSPSSTEKKVPPYLFRSRSKTKRQSRRSNTKRELFDQPDDGLRLDDLPPHPSVLKRTLEKTYSYPCTSDMKEVNTGHTCKNIVIRGKKNSELRRNSLPEATTQRKDTMKMVDQGRSMKDLTVNAKQNVRKISMGSSSKTTSEEDSRGEMTTSSSDHQRKQPSFIRSKTVPNFVGESYLPDTDTRVITDAEDFEYRPTDMTGPLHLSLCGCGFLGMYHLGVISSLLQRGPGFLDRVEKVGGASAGAIMAAIMLTSPEKIEESTEHIQNLAKEIRKKPLGPLTPGYNFTRSLRSMLHDILPEDAHETTQRKLFVSVTNADTKKNELLSDFQSRDELIEALVASCYIPIYAGIKLPTIRGKKYIDGGLSNNMPVFETGRTITISPFDGKSDIGPKIGQEAEKKAHFINVQNQDFQVNANNIKKSSQAFFPPKRQSLQEYFEKGRFDANRFLIREGLFEITAQTKKKAVLYESSV